MPRLRVGLVSQDCAPLFSRESAWKVGSAKESEQAMAEPSDLNHPWLVAVWPGMGHVALNAGVYLLAKLEMTAFAEFEATDLFDVDQVEVKDGLSSPGGGRGTGSSRGPTRTTGTTWWCSSARPSRRP